MKQFSFQKEVYDLEATAHFLSVSKTSVEAWIQKGWLHTYRLPAAQSESEYLKRTLIHRRQIEQFLERYGVEI